MKKDKIERSCQSEFVKESIEFAKEPSRILSILVPFLFIILVLAICHVPGWIIWVVSIIFGLWILVALIILIVGAIARSGRKKFVETTICIALWCLTLYIVGTHSPIVFIYLFCATFFIGGLKIIGLVD